MMRFVHPYKEHIDRVLAHQGGFYTFEDLLDGIHKGDFQSFAEGSSWAVTRVMEFPRKSAIEIVFMIGDMTELRSLEQEILDFARKMGVTMGIANGRLGLVNKAFPGWKAVTATFIKDFKNV